MGRPIKRKFFAGTADLSNAGMGVYSVSISNSGTNYAVAPTITFSQPDLTNGTLAVGHVTVSNGHIASFVVDTAGSGYTADPAIALTNVGTGTGATFSVNLGYADNTGKIACSAYIPNHPSSPQGSAILKQESSRRYLVQNYDGDGQCHLTATATQYLVAGQMNIIARDSVGGDYYVTKLTARKAQLYPNTGTQFAAGTLAAWTTGTATLNYSVQIATN